MAQREPKYSKWLNAVVLIGFGWLAILLELAPLGGRASATPSPDLLLCVSAFLVLRRPTSTPAGLVLILGLTRDLVGGDAVGLGALTLLGAVEVLRIYRERLLRRTFAYEVAVIALAALAVSAAQVAVLTLALTPSPALEILGLGAVGTVVAYVVIAAFFRFFLRMRPDPLETRNLIRAGR